MKLITDSSVKAPYKMYLLALAVVFALEIPVLALKMTKMPKTMQTKVREPRERAISLKLPLQQPRFHWRFMSRKDFLSGKMLLRIIRDGESTEIVIFENGQFSDGWEAMQPPPKLGKEEIYFGFVSTGKYLTAPGDKLELELTVTKNLEGMGALQTGILPAGTYTSRGTYSWLVDESDTSWLAEELKKEGRFSTSKQEALLKKHHEMGDYRAFLESWKDQWPLKITSEKGWLPRKKAAEFRNMLEKLNTTKLELPTGSAGSPVRDKNFFQKYLWHWIAIPYLWLWIAIPAVMLLFIVIVLHRVFARR